MKLNEVAWGEPGTLHERLVALVRDPGAMAEFRVTAERYVHKSRDSYEVQEIVTDVIEDALEGVLSGHPDRPLVSQLNTEVQRRATQLHNRARRSPFVRLSDVHPDELVDEKALPDSALGHGDVPTYNDPALADRIRELARGDATVELLLDLYGRGLSRRRDARRAGMSVASYRAALRRLATYAAAAKSDRSLAPVTSEPTTAPTGSGGLIGRCVALVERPRDG